MDSPVIETQEAQETAAKVKKPLDPRVQYYLRIIGTLFVITAIVAVLLSLVNMVTRPMIDTHAEEKRVAALSKVMPDADFEPVTHLPEGIDGLVSITKATRNGSPAGCCVQITTNGFGGSLELMVGVDGNGAVTGVDILSHAETLNTNRHGWLLEQYPGHSGEILSPRPPPTPPTSRPSPAPPSPPTASPGASTTHSRQPRPIRKEGSPDGKRSKAGRG